MRTIQINNDVILASEIAAVLLIDHGSGDPDYEVDVCLKGGLRLTHGFETAAAAKLAARKAQADWLAIIDPPYDEEEEWPHKRSRTRTGRVLKRILKRGIKGAG